MVVNTGPGLKFLFSESAYSYHFSKNSVFFLQFSCNFQNFQCVGYCLKHSVLHHWKSTLENGFTKFAWYTEIVICKMLLMSFLPVYKMKYIYCHLFSTLPGKRSVRSSGHKVWTVGLGAILFWRQVERVVEQRQETGAV